MTFSIQEKKLVDTLEQMTDNQKMNFVVNCLWRLYLPDLLTKSDTMLFTDSIMTMQQCLDDKLSENELADFLAYTSKRCAELHNTSAKPLKVIENQYHFKATSFAADAIYAASEVIYHHVTNTSCPVNIMHVLENLRLSKKWQANNDPKEIMFEYEWQINNALNFLKGNYSTPMNMPKNIVNFPGKSS